MESLFLGDVDVVRQLFDLIVFLSSPDKTAPEPCWETI